jgi:hypothetical protein
MRTYQFKVKGLPPKKDGAQSMWGKKLESERLVLLRQAALQALKKQPPLERNIKLTLNIHLPINNRSIGDLDTFVTGVCDGLMATRYGGNLNPIWNNQELKNVHPTNTIAIYDDIQVVSIRAEKIIDSNSRQWYEVILEGE